MIFICSSTISPPLLPWSATLCLSLLFIHMVIHYISFLCGALCQFEFSLASLICTARLYLLWTLPFVRHLYLFLWYTIIFLTLAPCVFLWSAALSPCLILLPATIYLTLTFARPLNISVMGCFPSILRSQNTFDCVLYSFGQPRYLLVLSFGRLSCPFVLCHLILCIVFVFGTLVYQYMSSFSYL